MEFLRKLFIKTNNQTKNHNANTNISDEDIAFIMELRNTSEKIIRNEMNF